MNQELKAEFNRETSKIPWSELQRFFASGNAIFVDKTLDLIEVAVACKKDNAKLIEDWMCSGVVAKVNDQQAKTWLKENIEVWAVVVAPWVLVQELKPRE